MGFAVKRAYAEPSTDDGYRVLVDRIWPRGLSRDEISIEEWRKEAAPSDHLREAFHSNEISWQEFRNSYLAELKEQREKLRHLVEIAKKKKVTLVFASANEEHNNAVVLRQYLEMLE